LFLTGKESRRPEEIQTSEHTIVAFDALLLQRRADVFAYRMVRGRSQELMRIRRRSYQRPRKPRFISNANETTRSVTRELLTCLSYTAAIPRAIMIIASIRMLNHLLQSAASPKKARPNAWRRPRAHLAYSSSVRTGQDSVQCPVRRSWFGWLALAGERFKFVREIDKPGGYVLARHSDRQLPALQGMLPEKTYPRRHHAPATLTPTERQFLSPEHGDYPAFILNLKRIETAVLSEIAHFGLRAP
jgi:hypothetical protein